VETMNDTERIAHSIMDRALKANRETAHDKPVLRNCATAGCANRCAGTRYCRRCEEELNGEPYPLANILATGIRWRRLANIAFALMLFAWLLAIIVML